MMQTYAEYDSYQEYSINHSELLLPDHWQVEKCRFAFNFSKGLTITKENLQETGIPCVNYGEIHSKFGFEVDPLKHDLKCVDPSYLKLGKGSLLAKGDFVFADTSEDIEGSGNFTRLNSTEPTFAGYHTLIARAKGDANTRFLAYVLDSASFRKQVRKSVKGVKVFSITQAILKNTSVWLPPLHDQTAIAGFLDEKIAKIDELVGIKRRQIALLGERKQILIQNAITKGLNPNAPLKDSGVDWIGKIPAHWEVKPAKHLFIEVDERSENGEEELLSVSHMTGVTPRSEKTVSMFLAEDYSGSKICKKDDLVFNIMWAWMGALGVSPLVGIVSPSYAVFRQLKAQTFNPVYLEMLMQSLGYVEHYNKVSTGLHSSRLRFYSHMFLSMKIGYPSFDEQEQIIEFLNRETGKITKAISVLENQITKLNEYKTTLINAAVTGKIKVA